MDTFFHPASIAVVGASNHKGGYQIIRNLLYGYKGAIYPVNPRYKEIEGILCFPSIEDVPHAVDMAIILVPAVAVPSALEGCARKGVLRVMIQSAGFAEVGDKGRDIQERCAVIAKEAGMRIWGPNCMGLVDVPKKRLFTFMNTRVYEDGLIPGRISLISQSGIFSAAFLADLMSRRTVGIGKVCSIGNKMDLDECDLLEYLLKDTETDVVALYLESIPRGRLFAQIAAGATKPVVVLNGGKSKAGARAAMSHTSSLSGNSRLLDGVLRMSGVTLANDFHQMIDLVRALAMIPDVPPSCRVAVLAFSGGAGILSCDLLEKHGFHIAQLSENTKQALGSIFPDWMPAANPVDLYPAMELHGRVSAYDQAVSIVLKDPNVDVILLHYVEGLSDEIMDLSALKKRADNAGKAVLFWLIGRRESTRLFHCEAQRCGIPVYEEISRAVECLSAAAHFQRREVAGETSDCYTVPPSEHDTHKEFILRSTEERICDEYDSKGLLSEWDIPVVKEKLVETLSEADKSAEDIGFPIVLKGLLPGEVHKTESGLVHLGISTRTELQNTYQEIQKKLRGRGRILIQRQAERDYELIAGFIRDDQFGPCIMFGLGGVLSELQPDVVFALAPLKRPEAMELIDRIHGRRLLQGFRGMIPLKRELMAQILVNLGNLGAAYSQIEQIDINPVIVSAGSPVAVDATVILRSEKLCQK